MDDGARRLQAQLDVRGGVGRVGLARGFVRQLVDRLDGADVDAALLCTSELVTNALTHGAGTARLHLEGWEDGSVRIRVADPGPGAPTAHPLDLAPPSSRGLALVDALAARWGVDPAAGGGKAVWCDVPAGRP